MPDPEQEEVTVGKEDIKNGLKQLGLKRGDIVGVHSSLSSFGYVEGGADTVIDALLETVGEDGTVLMPTHSTNLKKYKRTPEEVEMGLLWKFRVLPYDPKETPCNTGRLPDTFWRRKEAARSSNPVFSIAAIGKNAKELCKGWKKVLEADGYILLLGVDLGRCTAMHLAEERVEFPEHILKKMTMPPELVENYPDPEWETDFGPYPDFPKMEEPCREHGIMMETKIGKAQVKLIRLRELIDLYAEYLRENPDMFYGGD
ncbi:MAG: AAC(3) family N-acetyltransferase [Methanobacteriota archaeon]|nr:MAG: AAC(3) family N-acetyltransferase [Euryarchaeota archaeon]